MPERKRPQVEVEPWFDHLIDHFKQWAHELGVDIAGLSITDSAGKKKKPPKLSNRATQMRFREGRAFEIRHDLYTALSKLESSMSAPTATGKMMVGVEEWARLGRAMAQLNATKFEAALESARDHLAKMEADARQGIAFESTPKRAEPPTKKAPRAIAKTSIISPLGEDPREADALPWEKGKKKPA